MPCHAIDSTVAQSTGRDWNWYVGKGFSYPAEAGRCEFRTREDPVWDLYPSCAAPGAKAFLLGGVRLLLVKIESVV